MNESDFKNLTSMDLSLFSASSSSTSNAPQLKYEVFLSFRGEDTRYNFTSHLHKALCDKKIQTFIDYELRRGDEISPSLIKAIEDSHISIIIFSQGYASSTWCLEELVKILECKKKYGQIVMPIFYEVDPSLVRHQTGSFADAFAKHEQRFKESLDKVQRWKDTLKQAANLSGSDSRVIKPEPVLIEAIVEDVLKRLNESSSSDTNDLVGIDSRIQEIESLLCIETNDVRSVGIWGIGGIGKTTLAGAVYDKISCQFEGSHFIENVREESEQSGGLNRLRRELLSAILGDGNIDRGSSFAASNFTKKRLGRKKLLIVFDDVASFRQIESLIRGLDCLGFGSRIIITTRDRQILKNCRVDQIYKVDELSDHDALKLFCLYAFGQNYPKEDYEELSNRVVEYVGGVPLALKVLGSSLLDKRKEVWESAMNKLEVNLDKDIHKILRISFDGLDDNEQNIFLDIACFFKGRGINLVKGFLDACDFFTEVGISALIDKSLITITNNTITMHDLLQAMGREIVRQESSVDPGKRSRLWHHKDIYNVLTDNTGTEKIEAISLDMSKIGDIHLNPRAFMKMHKLRFLKFDSSLSGKNANRVQNSPHLYLSKLVTVDLSSSNKLKSLPNNIFELKSLKHLNLTRCSKLDKLPDEIGTLDSLRDFEAKGSAIKEVPSSIIHLNNLQKLSFERCKGHDMVGLSLPPLSGLHSLRELDLTNCAITKLPDSLGSLSSLKELYLGRTILKAYQQVSKTSLTYST
ncbi:hypothetical protein Ddye_029623 [Dipteronia dyeriana]|uniref:ADP-ribosyl cyclase/cyclic ADP-ribose hydrolase n=1 Tax=Dipteronia dyeriana TaxID=168575 RepID=A0AAD9WKU9_9ROSI|nr:hypothetical protein Ddye_029623 [Dipteronia dyeriana]